MKRLKFTSGFASNERGQILVLTAVLLTAILGIAALSLDAAFMYDERNRLFAAADAAAKAAALEMRRSGAANLQTFANHEVAVHGFNPAAAGTSVQVNHPPASGPFAGDTDYVETIVSRQTSTFFGRLLGAANLTPGARAVAGGSPHPDCIIALNSMTLSISGARLDAVNCGIWVGDGGLANSGMSA